MVDLEKASKQELIDILIIEASLIEDMIKLREEARYGTESLNFSLFVDNPDRRIFVDTVFFKALVEKIRPEITIIPKEIQDPEDKEFNKRFFILNLCDNDYEIFDIFTDKEA